MATGVERSALSDGSLFNALSDASPAMILNGQLQDVFPDAQGNFVPPVDILSLQALERAYDIVMVYDAVQHRVRFADEYINQASEAPSKMRNAVNELQLRVLNTAGENMMNLLLDEDIASLENIRPDRLILRVAEKIMDHESGLSICLIIDDAHLYIRSESGSTAGVRPEEVEKFVTKLQFTPGNHLVLLDKRDAVRLDADVVIHSIQGTTKEDIKAAIGTSVDLDANPSVLSLATGVPIRSLRRLSFDEESRTPEALLRSLRTVKEESIAAMANGVARCALDPEGADHVAMHPKEKEFWLREAKLLEGNSKNVAQGCLLMGPPGTGKSLRARYLAQQLHVPYLECVDTGSQGLRGMKLHKYQQIFRAAIAAKPCVLFFDELDKEFPNSQRSGDRSNDDAEVIAYIQRQVGSPEMRGVYIVGATNNPENMATALLRSGRFGNRMAILAPETEHEKNSLLGAVLKQFFPDIAFSDEYVSSVTQHIPPCISGSDYRELVRRASVDSGEETESLHRSLLTQLREFQWTTTSEDTLSMQHIALEMDTVSTWRRNKAHRDIPKVPQEIRLGTWEAGLQTRENNLQGHERKISDLATEISKREEALRRLEETISKKRNQLNAIAQLKQKKMLKPQISTAPSTEIAQPKEISQTNNTDARLIAAVRNSRRTQSRIECIPEVTFEENLRRLAVLKQANLCKDCYYEVVREDGIINIKGEVVIHDPSFTELPHNLRVHRRSAMEGGVLDLRGTGITYIPNAWAWHTIDCSDTPLEIVDPRIAAFNLKFNNTRLTSLPLASSRFPDHTMHAERENEMSEIHLENTAVSSLPASVLPTRGVFCTEDNTALISYLDARGMHYSISHLTVPRFEQEGERDETLMNEEELRALFGPERFVGLEELRQTFGESATKNICIPALPRWLAEAVYERKTNLRLRIPMSVKDMLKKSHVAKSEVWDPKSRISITECIEADAINECYWSETTHYGNRKTDFNTFRAVTYILRVLRAMYAGQMPEQLHTALLELYDINEKEVQMYEQRMSNSEARKYAPEEQKFGNMMKSLSAINLLHYSGAEYVQDALVAKKTGKIPFKFPQVYGDYKTAIHSPFGSGFVSMRKGANGVAEFVASDPYDFYRQSAPYSIRLQMPGEESVKNPAVLETSTASIG